MKSFALYVVERDFLQASGLKMSDLREMLDFGVPEGPAYSRQLPGRRRQNRIFVSDNDTVFDKFVQSAMRKMGGLAVAGALMFLKYSYKAISSIMGFAGGVLLKWAQFLAKQGSGVLKGYYDALMSHLESTDDLSKEEKEQVRASLKR